MLATSWHMAFLWSPTEARLTLLRMSLVARLGERVEVPVELIEGAEFVARKSLQMWDDAYRARAPRCLFGHPLSSSKPIHS